MTTDTDDARSPDVPADLFSRLRADPSRAPEHLALAAARRHGPAAAAWAAEQRATAGARPDELAKQAKRRHARLARVGGFATVIPDLVALAWIQSRMVFFIAAALGRDPRDPVRPAELLVLQELYPDVPTAQAALAGTGRHLAVAWAGARRDRDRTLATRLLRMVGKRAGKRVAGRLVPGLAMVTNAVGNERDTRALADRAIAYYSR